MQLSAHLIFYINGGLGKVFFFFFFFGAIPCVLFSLSLSPLSMTKFPPLHRTCDSFLPQITSLYLLPSTMWSLFDDMGHIFFILCLYCLFQYLFNKWWSVFNEINDNTLKLSLLLTANLLMASLLVCYKIFSFEKFILFIWIS